MTFSDFSDIAFQVILTSCDKPDDLSYDRLKAVSSDSNLTQNIIRETIKAEEKGDRSRQNTDAFQS